MFTLRLLACLLSSVHMYLQNQQLPTVTQLWIVAKLAEMPSVVTGGFKKSGKVMVHVNE